MTKSEWLSRISEDDAQDYIMRNEITFEEWATELRRRNMPISASEKSDLEAELVGVVAIFIAREFTKSEVAHLVDSMTPAMLKRVQGLQADESAS